jgi:hypothetical protein
MNDLIYQKLKQTASQRSLVTYGELAPLVDLDMDNPAHRNEIGQLLGDISKFEHRQGRPMLSAVAVLSDTKMPGKGFFTLAKELRLLSGDDELEFFSGELNRVYAHWAS